MREQARLRAERDALDRGRVPILQQPVRRQLEGRALGSHILELSTNVPLRSWDGSDRLAQHCNVPAKQMGGRGGMNAHRDTLIPKCMLAGKGVF